MAELLVLNHDSWMSSLTQKQIDRYVKNYGPKWLTKYNARQRKGDIVEVRPDGFFTGPGRAYNKEHFDVVIVKDKSYDELKKDYSGCLEKIEGIDQVFDPDIGDYTTVVRTSTFSKFKANVGVVTDKAEISSLGITLKVVE